MPFLYEKITLDAPQPAKSGEVAGRDDGAGKVAGRDDAAGAVTGWEITGYEGNARKLAVPALIEGLPVLSIGRHAFTDKNKGLEELRLPDSIRVIRAFAFYFCNDLTALSLCDSVTDYYDRAIGTCTSLRSIEIEMRFGRHRLVRKLLDDSDRQLRVTFRYPGHPEDSLQLIFPDYHNSTVEDTRAQTFHIHIEGSGFSYRECVRSDGIRIKEYDRLFQRALSADNQEVSVQIAAGRLLYPAGLDEAAAGMYRAHLKAGIETALRLALLPENAEWAGLLMREELLDEAALDYALQLAGERKLPALAGELMDYRHKHFQKKSAAAGRLSLDAF